MLLIFLRRRILVSQLVMVWQKGITATARMGSSSLSLGSLDIFLSKYAKVLLISPREK